MKKMNYILLSLLTAILVVFTACDNEWDAHYNTNDSTDSSGKSNLNLLEYIGSQPELSTFYQMLSIAEYDAVISDAQAYTVWAPNNDALQNVDLNDKVQVLEIVSNHIARFSIPTSGIVFKPIFMLSQKFVSFEMNPSGYTFGKKQLLQANFQARNGIVHVVEDFVPYIGNIWEFIGVTSGLDSLKAYMYSQGGPVFDPISSVEIGVNNEGKPIYDSLFIPSNKLLIELGSLHREDSVYSMLLPNNTAWTDAYERIKNSYKTLDQDGGVAVQRMNTQHAIVQDLIFRGRVTAPNAVDSLISTSNNVFHNPGYLFENVSPGDVSNGIAYITDQLKFKASESWQQEIRIEAENSLGRKKINVDIYPRSSLGTGFTTSNDKYILVEPTSGSSLTKPAIIFDIPNTLSAKYNIYCVFAPSSIGGKKDYRPTQANFSMLYVDENGKQLTRWQRLSVDDNTTDTIAMKKLFITEMDFPFANFTNDEEETLPVTVSLKIEAAVKKETTELTRSLRIDCIILEPVE